MVTPNMYLKDIYSMSDGEKQELSKRLAMLENKQSPNLDYDLITISALPRSHGFISVAHQLDSDRVWSELKGFVKLLKPLVPEDSSKDDKADGADKSNGADRTNRTNKTNETNGTNKTNGTDKADKADKAGTLTAPKGTRPKHFDEWFDEMSPGLQAKVEQLKDLHTKKVYYRQMVEQLAEDPNHSKQDMALASTAAVNYEKKIQAIYDQADIEWAELCGQTVSDEAKKLVVQAEVEADKAISKVLGGDTTNKTSEANKANGANGANETNEANGTTPSQSKPASQMTEEELNQLTVAEVNACDLPDGPKQYLINRRVENARKYLREMTPETMSDKQKQKAADYVQELADAGKALSPKAKENLEKIGIKIG